MSFTFNGATKRITANVSVFTVNDIYSRWKDWVLTGNAQYLAAFRASGGEPIGGGQFAGVYVFLRNGWGINVPQDITVQGNLFRDPDDVSGVPLYTDTGNGVTITLEKSVVALGYSTSGGTFTATDASRLAELWATLASSGVFNAAAFVNLVTGLTTEQAEQLLRLFNFRGLNAAAPINGDDSDPNAKTETDGTVTITHTINGNTITSQRSG